MSTGSGVCLRSGGYSLRSKGSSVIQLPSKSRLESEATKQKIPQQPPNEGVKSEATKQKIPLASQQPGVKSEATKQKIDSDEEQRRYFDYLSRTRNRKPLKYRGPRIYPKYPTSLMLPIPQRKTEAGPIADPEEYFFGKSEGIKNMAQNLAAEAMSYLQKTDSNWELVKPCMYQGESIAICFMLHVNFQAKRVDDPECPVQTFFAQVRYHQKHILFEVDCCVCLGPSDSMPETRDNQGCLFCSNYVHHPLGGFGGWSNGWPKWESTNENKLLDIAAAAASKKR